MKGALVRVGIDQTFGKWNAPIDPDSGQFFYVPIPENDGFHPGLERPYKKILPALEQFSSQFERNLFHDLKFPKSLIKENMHLDPDFTTLTYGDDGKNRGSRLKLFKEGDLISFYAGFNPLRKSNQKIIYALLGLYVVKEVVFAKDISRDRWVENAHTRKVNPGRWDIVVRAKSEMSGRLERCIPIGEWRNKAYRVRKDLLEEWGELSVKDGYIQRSAVPPLFLNPERFYNWFKKQGIALIPQNN